MKESSSGIKPRKFIPFKFINCLRNFNAKIFKDCLVIENIAACKSWWGDAPYVFMDYSIVKNWVFLLVPAFILGGLALSMSVPLLLIDLYVFDARNFVDPEIIGLTIVATFLRTRKGAVSSTEASSHSRSSLKQSSFRWTNMRITPPQSTLITRDSSSFMRPVSCPRRGTIHLISFGQ